MAKLDPQESWEPSSGQGSRRLGLQPCSLVSCWPAKPRVLEQKPGGRGEDGILCRGKELPPYVWSSLASWSLMT